MSIDFIKALQVNGSGKIGLVDHLDTRDLIDLAFSQGFNHVVQKSQPQTMREIRASRVMSQNPELFMKYPISSTLRPRFAGKACEKALTLAEWKIKTHVEKAAVLQGLVQLFDQSGMNSSLRDDVILTADEFMCNVLFNASQPDGVNSNDLQSSLIASRKTLRHPALIRVGAYDSNLAITCRDGFGTLNPMKILERLHLCVQNGPGKSMNFTDQGTAGIGSYMIFCACTSYFMAVQPGKFSQFCAIFPSRMGSRARSLMPKNIHWLQY